MTQLTVVTSLQPAESAIRTASRLVVVGGSPVNHPMENGSKGAGAVAPDEVPSDSDSDLEGDSAPRPPHITERRRVQNAIFSNWYGMSPRRHWGG